MAALKSVALILSILPASKTEALEYLSVFCSEVNLLASSLPKIAINLSWGLDLIMS